MKSILVDALRRANDSESETNLSDSGSFDATHEDFTATANQDLADAAFGEDAEELELLSTTRGLVVGDDNVSVPPELGETMASGTVLLTVGDYVIPDNRSLPTMPRLARHVPVLCLTLAFVAGTAWFAYQQLELRKDASSLGAFAIHQSNAGGTDGVVVADELQRRFRYLDAALPAGDDGNAE